MDVVGCLCIGEITVGKRGFSDRFPFQRMEGVALRPCAPAQGEAAWEGMQAALQRVREEFGGASIQAVGSGCFPALALSAQLPVERLALIAPERAPYAFRRMERFARRNLSLCVCDILAVDGEACVPGLRAGGLGAHSRLTWLRLRGENGSKPLTDSKNALDSAISCFLRTGELPKSLAENREMCIIYG